MTATKFNLPLTAVFNDHFELSNFRRSIETLGMELYQTQEMPFPFKGAITYDFVNSLVLVRWMD